MGKASRRKQENREMRKAQEAAVGTIEPEAESMQESPKRNVINIVKDAVFGDAKNAKDEVVGKVRSQVGIELLKGCEKLVKEDIKKGKVKDVEAYVRDSIDNGIKPKPAVMKMISNSGLTLEEIEATIRQTLKVHYAGKV